MNVPYLSNFLKAIPGEPRITARHIALYLAIFREIHPEFPDRGVPLRKDELMRFAKISGRATYFRCIHDLHEMGFIRYVPAGHRWMESVAYLK
jgi:hypothetical protein